MQNMGKFGAEQYMPQRQVGTAKSKKATKNKKKPVKITYISSPTMFRAANASEFRSIVQELTGKDSKVIDTWDDDYNNNYNTEEEEAPSNYETPSLKMDSDQSLDDIFSSYSCSSSQEIDDTFFWRNVPDQISFFEFTAPHVFV